MNQLHEIKKIRLRKFHCPGCSEYFDTLEEANVHGYRSWIKNPSHSCSGQICPTCEDRFKGITEFMKHINSHLVSVSWKPPTMEDVARLQRVDVLPSFQLFSKCIVCEFCSVGFNILGDFIRHLKDVHHKPPAESFISKQNVLQCIFCETIFAKVEQLSDHFWLTHRMQTQMCNWCDKTYITKLDLKIHTEVEHVMHTYAQLCTFDSFTPNQKIRLRKFQCPGCSEYFDTLEEANVHGYRSWIKNPSHSCSGQICLTCEDRFKSITEFMKHINSHLVSVNWKPPTMEDVARLQGVNILPSSNQQFSKCVVCEFCSVGFNKLRDFEEHLKDVHHKLSAESFISKESVLQCIFCETIFANSKQLDDHFWVTHHMQTHMCKWCNKTYITKLDLKIHTEVEHVKGLVRCKLCSKLFSIAEDLEKHIRIEHPESYNAPSRSPMNGTIQTQQSSAHIFTPADNEEGGRNSTVGKTREVRAKSKTTITTGVRIKIVTSENKGSDVPVNGQSLLHKAPRTAHACPEKKDTQNTEVLSRNNEFKSQRDSLHTKDTPTTEVLKAKGNPNTTVLPTSSSELLQTTPESNQCQVTETLQTVLSNPQISRPRPNSHDTHKRNSAWASDTLVSLLRQNRLSVHAGGEIRKANAQPGYTKRVNLPYSQQRPNTYGSDAVVGSKRTNAQVSQIKQNTSSSHAGGKIQNINVQPNPAEANTFSSHGSSLLLGFVGRLKSKENMKGPSTTSSTVSFPRTTAESKGLTIRQMIARRAEMQRRNFIASNNMCGGCHRQFKTTYSLWQHIGKSESRPCRFFARCPMCLNAFGTLHEVMDHITKNFCMGLLIQTPTVSSIEIKYIDPSTHSTEFVKSHVGFTIQYFRGKIHMCSDCGRTIANMVDMVTHANVAHSAGFPGLNVDYTENSDSEKVRNVVSKGNVPHQPEKMEIVEKK